MAAVLQVDAHFLSQVALRTDRKRETLDACIAVSLWFFTGTIPYIYIYIYIYIYRYEGGGGGGGGGDVIRTRVSRMPLPGCAIKPPGHMVIKEVELFYFNVRYAVKRV